LWRYLILGIVFVFGGNGEVGRFGKLLDKGKEEYVEIIT
jgi:hypothetical protein